MFIYSTLENHFDCCYAWFTQIVDFEVSSKRFKLQYLQEYNENMDVFGIKIHDIKCPFAKRNEPDLSYKKVLVPDSNFTDF